MFSSKAPDHLAFLIRHLAASAEQHGVEDAMARLSEATPQVYAQDLARLRGLLAGEPAVDTPAGLSPYHTLAGLLRFVTGDRQSLLAGFVDYLQDSRAVYDTFLTGIIGFLWYAVAVSAVAVLATYIYATGVYPQLAGLLRSVGEAPPALASVMFQAGGAPALTFALLAAVGLAAGGTLLFYRRIEQLQPMPRLPAWIPGAARLCRTYNGGLLLNFARLLNESGVAGEQALDQAALLSGHRRHADEPAVALTDTPGIDDQSMQQLAIARRLGTLDAELQAQCDAHLGQLSMALLSVRERLSLVLKLALFFYVGLLVVSMYQPLFQASSVF